MAPFGVPIFIMPRHDIQVKATRLEYMLEVMRYLNTENYKNDTLLEISGDTFFWHANFKSITKTKYPEIDVHDLPYEDESYDCIVLNQVLEHVANPWKAIKELYRVCSPGGMVIITSPFFYQFHGGDHGHDYWRFTPEGLECLCEDFSEILLKHRGGNGEMVKYMVDNPEHRYEEEFMNAALKKTDKEFYFVMSTIIARK